MNALRQGVYQHKLVYVAEKKSPNLYLKTTEVDFLSQIKGNDIPNETATIHKIPIAKSKEKISGKSRRLSNLIRSHDTYHSCSKLVD